MYHEVVSNVTKLFFSEGKEFCAKTLDILCKVWRNANYYVTGHKTLLVTMSHGAPDVIVWERPTGLLGQTFSQNV